MDLAYIFTIFGYLYSNLFRCARASLGIAFASLLDLLLIAIGFWIDRKVMQKQIIRGPPKTSSRLGGVFQGSPPLFWSVNLTDWPSVQASS